MKAVEPDRVRESSYGLASDISSETPHEIVARTVSRKARAGGQMVEPAESGSGFSDAINAGLGVETLVSRAAAGSGHGLPGDLRGTFERSLGTDLGGVRVHTGGEAAAAADALDARAYAVGQDVFMGAGQYNPSTSDGQFLLAHEVAHTVQQRGASAGPQCKLEVSEAGDAAEHEADHAAAAMIEGRAASVSSSSGVARKILRQSRTDASAPRAQQPAQQQAGQQQPAQQQPAQQQPGQQQPRPQQHQSNRQDELELAQITAQSLAMQQAAENRLDIGINSWDPWVLNQLPSAISRRFQRQEEVLAWIDWAQSAIGTVADIASNGGAITKAAGIGVKAIAAAARFISRDSIAASIAQARSELTRAAQQEFLRQKAAQRTHGLQVIGEFLQAHPLIGGEMQENNDTQVQVFALVDREFPQLTTSALPEISRILDRLFFDMEQRAEEQRQVQARAAQVRRVSAIMGLHQGQAEDRSGMPTEEEAHRANEMARPETHYTGPDVPLSEIYGGPR